MDRRIAVGGMGEVWEASDTRLGRSVAVKVLRPELSDDPEFLHRFRIEARTVASLDHSGIALVHDYGEDDGPVGGGRTAYLVMELVRGEPLSSKISRGPIDADETLEIIEQAARALQAAHARGFVHRDVKPGNILIRTDGVVKLTDFGIAKAADAVPVTRSGMVMGTAHYIAPEQASGGEAGPAGDVYSLGIVGYECLAGHRPFRADNAVAVAMMQVREEPPPLPEHVPDAARELIDAVLVKNPDHRYADGGEFAAAVAAVRRGEPLPRPSRMPAAEPVITADADAAPGGVTSVIQERVERLRSQKAERRGQKVSRRAERAVKGEKSAQSTPRTPARTPVPTPAPHTEPASESDSDPTGTPPPADPVLTPAPAASPAPLADASTPEPVRAVPAPPTEPLRLDPSSGPSGSLLLVLFLVLTLAAIALAVFILPGLFESEPTPSNPAPAGALGGTVTGQEAGLAGPAAGELFEARIVTERVR
nr:serine/threonine protein kinase [Pseudonocardia acidicola]